MGSQMVSTQYDPFWIKPGILNDLIYKSGELLWPHAGIAAVLINLLCR